MKYLYVEWLHEIPEEPIILISELDERRYEHRKLEIYKGGLVGYAVNNTKVHDTRLTTEPIPEIQDILIHKEFKPKYISKDDFTRIWNVKDNLKIVEIDVSNIRFEKKLHEKLKEKLDFPDFYGKNWDAITGLTEMPNILIFYGWNLFERELPSEAKMLNGCLKDYNQEFEDLPCFVLFH